jgi:hypothetical protein
VANLFGYRSGYQNSLMVGIGGALGSFIGMVLNGSLRKKTKVQL